MPIYFIRHGQSEFNATYKRGDPDPMIFDPPLTSLGRQQARQAREKIAGLGIKQVVSSPLTRALQTSQLIFEGIAPITVAAGHHEKLEHSGDVGRPPADLAPEFPALSFDHLPDHWWHEGPENSNGVPVESEETFLKRIAGFGDCLHQWTERPMAFVGHGYAFHALIGRMMENCEIHRYQPDSA